MLAGVEVEATLPAPPAVNGAVSSGALGTRYRRALTSPGLTNADLELSQRRPIGHQVALDEVWLRDDKPVNISQAYGDLRRGCCERFRST